MTQRLGMHMETLINSGQLCSREKKNILSGVHNILSTIEYVKQKQIPAALLSFDMDKAFDRCYIPYVCRVLKHMNLSDSFINIIQDMHAGISTQFILGGSKKSGSYNWMYIKWVVKCHKDYMILDLLHGYCMRSEQRNLTP